MLQKTHSALFVDMGLGKTIAALTVIAHLLFNFKVHRVLVIAPKKVSVEVWPKEITSWNHTRNITYTVLTGLSPKKREEAARSFTDMHIINRENVPWLVDFFKGDWPYDMVIIDESSSFKSPSAKRFKKLKRVLGLIERMVLLTGTPSSQKLLDLWSQIYLLDQGARLGRTNTAYKKTFFVSDYMGYKWELRPGAEKQIHSKLKDLCLALREEDYADLPERIYNTIELQLSPLVSKQYRELERECLITIDNNDIEAKNAAVLTSKLRQFCNGAMYKEDSREFVEVHDEKLDALEELIESCLGEPVLVAYEFKSDLARLRKRFKNGVDLNDHPKVVEQWNQGKIPIMFIHPASGGHGLNLQDGGHIQIWFGLTWSLELYRQLNKRLHRGSQQHPVIIYHLILKKTVDENVMDSLAGKYRTESALINALKQSIKERLVV